MPPVLDADTAPEVRARRTRCLPDPPARSTAPCSCRRSGRCRRAGRRRRPAGRPVAAWCSSEVVARSRCTRFLAVLSSGTVPKTRPGTVMLSLDGSTTTSSGCSNVTGQPTASDHQWPSVDGSAQSITTEYKRVDTAAPLQPSWSQATDVGATVGCCGRPGRGCSPSAIDGLTFDVSPRARRRQRRHPAPRLPTVRRRVVRRRAVPHRRGVANACPGPAWLLARCAAVRPAVISPRTASGRHPRPGGRSRGGTLPCHRS